MNPADIVERLRAHPGPDDTVTVQFRTMVDQRHEAAAEIERLRNDRDRLIAEIRALKEVKNYEPG